VPYQPHGVWTWTPFGGFAVASTADYRVTVLPPVPLFNRSQVSNSVSVVIERNVQPVPVSDAERKAIRNKLIADVEEAGGRGVNIPDIPETKPPFKGIEFASDGRLMTWVSMPSVRLDNEWVEPSAWDIFQHNGTFRGRLVLPSGFRMFYLRGDRMLGVQRMSDGVEIVRRYRIVWPI
jgi:hypothetical protein